MATDLPGPLYLDASALVKRYLPEPHSVDLAARLEGRRDLVASDLGLTEIVSSFARRRREGQLAADTLRRLHRAALADLDAAMFTWVELTREAHREAERLLVSLESVPLRASDALHLALAVAASARSVATFDQRLGGAARKLGFVTFP